MTAPLSFPIPNVTPSAVLPPQGGDASRQFAQLIQALLARQQMDVQQQQLATQQRVAEAQISQTQAQTVATLAQTEKFARESAGQAEAAKLFQQIVESGQELNQETLFGALAKLKKPEAIASFVQMVPDIGKLLTTPAAVRTAEAGATTAEAGAAVAPQTAGAQARTATAQAGAAELALQQRQQANQFARRLLANPSAKLPIRDPSIGQAVGMEALGILDFASRAADQDVASGGASTIIFARQLATQAAQASVRSYLDDLQNIAPGDAEAMRGIAGPLDPRRLMLFLPPGMSNEDFVKLTKSAVQSALAQMGGEARTPVDQLSEVRHSPAFKLLSPQDQESVLRTIAEVAAGRETINPKAPANVRALIRRGVRITTGK